MTETAELIREINGMNDSGRYREALELVGRALASDKDNYSLWIGRGNALYGLGQYAEAEESYLKAADLNEEDVVALANLAGVYFEEKRFKDGLAVCDDAIARNPAYLNTYIHQGNLLSGQERYEEALQAYKAAELIAPDDPLVMFNTANALAMTEHYERAADYFRRLLEETPQDQEYLYALAAMQEKMEDYALAAGTYLRMLAVQDSPLIHIMLSGCLYSLQLQNKQAEAMELTDAWLNAFPDNPVALHALETLKEAPEVKRASAEYVEELFDAFAESFDSVLEGLAYRAPLQVAKAVKNLDLNEDAAVLDLGCGTGLCGAGLKNENISFASLTGVDLSEKMLEKARSRGIYTYLEQSDLLAFLPQHPAAFDLVVSADVFTYLGDLSDLLAGMAGAVKHGGYAVFTVSENIKDPDTYGIEPSGRFTHGKNYIVSGLRENNFEVLSAVSVELRQELGAPVYGLLVICKKI